MTTDGLLIDDRVALDVTDGVADVRLARPDKHNALDARMFEAIASAAQAVATRDDVRVVVLSGEGPSFCAGLDLDHYGVRIFEGVFDDGAERTHGVSNLYQYVAMAWREAPQPVIAAVHGSTFGGGLQIALGADIRFATPDARLSVMETKWALIPDMAAMVTARRLVRDDVLRDLVFTARVLSGVEAQAAGLVTHVADDARAAALAMARDLAARSPRALRAAKRLVNATGLSDLEMLQAESAEQLALIHGPDIAEAFRARAEKRAPVYE